MDNNNLEIEKKFLVESIDKVLKYVNLDECIERIKDDILKYS